MWQGAKRTRKKEQEWNSVKIKKERKRGRICKRRERESVCVYVCAKEKERKRASERAKERERIRTRVRKQERRHKSIVVHGDTHTYTNHTRANTLNYIQVHTRDIYETQWHAILYIYDSIDDGAAHSHSVSRIVPQNFSFEFASRNLLFSNVWRVVVDI